MRFDYRCYFVESKASGVLPITDNFNDLPSGPEECHILCKKSKDCLQWDWRVQKLNVSRFMLIFLRDFAFYVY